MQAVAYVDGGKHNRLDASRMSEVPCKRCRRSIDGIMPTSDEGVDEGFDSPSISLVERGSLTIIVLSTIHLSSDDDCDCCADCCCILRCSAGEGHSSLLLLLRLLRRHLAS